MSKLNGLSNITFNITFINSQRGFVKNGMNQLKPKMHGVRAIYKFLKLQMTTWLNKSRLCMQKDSKMYLFLISFVASGSTRSYATTSVASVTKEFSFP